MITILLLAILSVNVVISSELLDCKGTFILDTNINVSERSSHTRLGKRVNPHVLDNIKHPLLNSNEISTNIQPSISSKKTEVWADTRFHFRKSIVIHNLQVNDDDDDGNVHLTSFPVLIDLYDTDLKNVAQANGDDIIFIDCLGSKLDHEIENFDRDYNTTHSHLVTWVKMNLSSTHETSLSMYYGNPDIGNQETPEAVWDENFSAVWHFSETSGIRYDSTRNHIDGSPQDFDNDEATIGQINGADKFDAINDYIDTYKYPFELGLDGRRPKTISMWVNPKDFNEGGIFEFGQYASMKYLALRTSSSPNQWSTDWGGFSNDFPITSLNQWVYFVITYEQPIFNVCAKSITGAKLDEIRLSKSINLNIGDKLTLKFGMAGGNYFNGTIDEVRVSSIARSAAWIRTEFYNQYDPSSFYSIGAQELDENPPQINDFGIDDKGDGAPTFYANVTDDLTPIKKVLIEINGSVYDMKQNTSELWIYQCPWVNFGDYCNYRVVNASDAHGNWIVMKSLMKDYIFNKDTRPPDVLQWEYYLDTNTFKANVTDYWGEIDTVIVNVTSYNLVATMVPITIVGNQVFSYKSDSLDIPNGPINFQIFINDTSGNEYSSPPHSGFVSINHAPFAKNITLNPPKLYSNSIIELSYNYYDDDSHMEAGTEIRWYKNNGTGFILQDDYNDKTMIPSLALVKDDQWYVTVRPKDGVLFGETVNSSELIGSVVILNTPPEITILKDEHPEFIIEDQDIILEKSYYRFTDTDGDRDQSIIWWYKDGDLQPEYTDQTQISANVTQPAECWYYIIRPYDGLDQGMNQTSPKIVIESRPRIYNCNITPVNDTEGHYYLEINTSDPRNEIKYVQYVIIYNKSNPQITGIVTSPKDGTEDIWVFDFHLSDYTYLNTEIIVEIEVVTELLDYSQKESITKSFTFNFIAEDNAPPRVNNAFFVLNNNLQPSNLSFYAEVEEYGSGIDEITLYYYFEEVNNGESGGGSGSSFFQEREVHWLQMGMEFHNRSGNIAIYSVTVPIALNGSNWNVIYRISTADHNSNINENAFQIDPQQAEQNPILYYGAEGIVPSSTLIIFIFLTIISVVIGSILVSLIYIKRSNRKSELIGLDRNLVLENFHQVSNVELLAGLNKHTLGIALATFDDTMGPTPIMITPKALKKETTVIYKVIFRSFSNCEFVADLNNINQAIFNFTLPEKTSVKVLAYSFALNRPHFRGGQENITLSIMIYPPYFSIIDQFANRIIERIKKIHELLNSSPEDKRAISLKIIKLREMISKLIISHSKLYGNYDNS
jgi:hypothetical protein